MVAICKAGNGVAKTRSVLRKSCQKGRKFMSISRAGIVVLVATIGCGASEDSDSQEAGQTPLTDQEFQTNMDAACGGYCDKLDVCTGTSNATCVTDCRVFFGEEDSDDPSDDCRRATLAMIDCWTSRSCSDFNAAAEDVCSTDRNTRNSACPSAAPITDSWRM